MSDEAFRELVRVLEEAVQAGADSVGLEWEDRDLVVVHYFGAMGREEAPIPQELEQAVIEEIVKRAGLADKFRGKMQVCLLGKDHELVVDERANSGESDYILTLKKSNTKESKPSFRENNTMSETPLKIASGNYGRNDPCPCGSGKKYKKCCLRKQEGSLLID